MFNEKICPVCGKLFICRYKHAYRIRNKHGNLVPVCSWKCERKYENDRKTTEARKTHTV